MLSALRAEPRGDVERTLSRGETERAAPRGEAERGLALRGDDGARSSTGALALVDGAVAEGLTTTLGSAAVVETIDAVVVARLPPLLPFLTRGGGRTGAAFTSSG